MRSGSSLLASGVLSSNIWRTGCAILRRRPPRPAALDHPVDCRDELPFEPLGRLVALDVLPLVVATEGSYDEEGKELTAPTYVDGYHVNVRALDGEDGEALAGYEVDPTPATPARVWA